MAEAKLPAGMVNVRITKFGDGKVSKGEHEAAVGEKCYAKDEIVMLPAAIAEELEARNLAEIQ